MSYNIEIIQKYGTSLCNPYFYEDHIQPIIDGTSSQHDKFITDAGTVIVVRQNIYQTNNLTLSITKNNHTEVHKKCNNQRKFESICEPYADEKALSSANYSTFAYRDLAAEYIHEKIKESHKIADSKTMNITEKYCETFLIYQNCVNLIYQLNINPHETIFEEAEIALRCLQRVPVNYGFFISNKELNEMDKIKIKQLTTAEETKRITYAKDYMREKSYDDFRLLLAYIERNLI